MLEGLALESRQALQGLERYGGVPKPKNAIAIGGSSRNDLLMRIKASSLGLPYVISEVAEATALGAAMIGGIGAGVYGDMADAVASVAVAGHRVEPQPNESKVYERLYYRRLPAALPDTARPESRDR